MASATVTPSAGAESSISATTAISTSSPETIESTSSQTPESVATPESVESEGSKSAAEGAESTSQKDAASADETVVGDDGRLIPAKYKELFKQDKFIRGLFFADKALREHFPGGVKDAIAAKQAIEEYGGPEAVAQKFDDLQAFEAVDQQFMAGDPALVDSLAEVNPEAFSKLIEHGIERFADANPEQYNYVMGRIVFATVNQAEAIHQAYNILSSLKELPEAQQVAQSLSQWYAGLQQLASRVPEKKIDPERQRFEQEREQFRQQQSQLLISQAASQAQSHLNTGIETSLARELKSSGINLANLKQSNAESYDLLISNIKQALQQAAMSDKVFLRNYESALEEGDIAKAVKLANAKNDRIIGDTVARIVRTWGGIGTRKQATQAQRQQTQSASTAPGATMVAKMPDRFDINWSHPETRVIDRVAVLKNGKKVTWN